jgi:hypothetical protein
MQMLMRENELLMPASVIASPNTLPWTGDKQLAEAASQFRVEHKPQ